MEWIEYKIEVKPGFEQIVENALHIVDVGAFSIDDPNLVDSITQNPGDWDYIDEKFLREKEKELGIVNTTFNIYFSNEDQANKKISSILDNLERLELFHNKDFIINKKTVEDKDWAENWKKYYKPIEIGEKFVIKPSWESYKNIENKLVIEMDPGMAFGTGTHESTYMCIELLEKYMETKNEVYDVGCGSGILSIVAHKLGAKKVTAIDMDPTAVKVAKQNITNNSMEETIKVLEGDLLSIVNSKVDLVVANILAEIIISMIKDVKLLLKKDGIFISSGIIVEKAKTVEKELIESGFEVLEIKRKNSWVAIVAKLK